MAQQVLQKLPVATAFIQGIYYIITGIWPWLSIGTFQAVAGPKTDLWLVKTVGILIVVTGIVLFFSAIRKQFPAEVYLLGTGNAAALLLVDVLFVYQKRISPVYLLDAVAEGILLAAWLMSWFALYQKNSGALR